jgi:hypothetical protein
MRREKERECARYENVKRKSKRRKRKRGKRRKGRKEGRGAEDPFI